MLIFSGSDSFEVVGQHMDGALLDQASDGGAAIGLANDPGQDAREAVRDADDAEPQAPGRQQRVAAARRRERVEPFGGVEGGHFLRPFPPRCPTMRPRT